MKIIDIFRNIIGISYIILIIVLPIAITVIKNKRRLSYSKFENREVTADFEVVYPHLHELYISEVKKIKIKKLILKLSIIGLILLIGGTLCLLSSDTSFSKIIIDYNMLFVLAIIGVIALIFYLDNITKKGETRFVNRIIFMMSQYLFPDIHWNTKKRLSLEYTNTIQAENYHNIANDFILGDISKECQLELGAFSETESANMSCTFNGCCASIDCNTKVTEEIIISNQGMKSKERLDNVIYVESPEFYNSFEVSSFENYDVSSLLSDKLIEKLMAFNKEYDVVLKISIRSNNIYLKIYTERVFIKDILKTEMDKNLIFMYYGIVKFLIEAMIEAEKCFKA